VVFASTLTKVHPGAGRSPGVVDLPVVRDPLGIWYIPGSEVKGSLKTSLGHKLDCISNRNNQNIIDCGKNDNCKKLCCLLGPELEGDKGASKVSISDFYPVLVPAPSAEKGVVYVTGKLLLARLKALLDAAETANTRGTRNDSNTLSGFIENLLKSLEDDKAYIINIGRSSSEGTGAGDNNSSKGDVHLGTITLKPSIIPIESSPDLSAIKGLHPLYQALGFSGRILVLPNNALKAVLNSLLEKRTRIRLDRVRKTVAPGALWTEEYIPWGTLLAGIIVGTGYENTYCKNSGDTGLVTLKKWIEEELGSSLVVGGKETVGSGLIKLGFYEEKPAATPGNGNGGS